jgi:hypothetical protein
MENKIVFTTQVKCEKPKDCPINGVSARVRNSSSSPSPTLSGASVALLWPAEGLGGKKITLDLMRTDIFQQKWTMM